MGTSPPRGVHEGYTNRRSVIISRTPVRVSLCGGGTDLEAFWGEDPNGGAVTSMAISRYIYVTANRRFDNQIRLSYSKTEIVDHVDDLQHAIVQEALKMTGISKGIEITTIADIPSRGTGLGSSSALAVGLLHALHVYEGRWTDAAELASSACELEIERLGEPIGMQDQYAAAFGGINTIHFQNDGTVVVEPVRIDAATQLRISNEFTLVYTGLTRSANSVLEEQKKRTVDEIPRLQKMRDQAFEVRKHLEKGDLSAIGSLLNDAWNLKRALAPNITNQEIDDLYESLLSLGATGGKLLGAGGGGFILIHGNEGMRTRIHSAYPSMKMLSLDVDASGSRMIHTNRRLEST